MKQIPLTQGQFAIVDDIDYVELSKHKWCAHRQRSGNFYAIREAPRKNGKRFMVRMHREILGLEYGDSHQADHHNHNTLDNKRSNLRVCTNQQNSRNQKAAKNKSSLFKGVCWDKRDKKWQASIRVDGKLKNLGYYKDEIEAALAYNIAAKKYFGEFAFLNKIP